MKEHSTAGRTVQSSTELFFDAKKKGPVFFKGWKSATSFSTSQLNFFPFLILGLQNRKNCGMKLVFLLTYPLFCEHMCKGLHPPVEVTGLNQVFPVETHPLLVMLL